MEEEITEFAKKALPILRKYGYIDSKIWKITKISVIIIFLITIITFLSFLSFQIYEGKFLNIDNSTCNNINENQCPIPPQCPSNNCDCSPTFSCQINFTDIQYQNQT